MAVECCRMAGAARKRVGTDGEELLDGKDDDEAVLLGGEHSCE